MITGLGARGLVLVIVVVLTWLAWSQPLPPRLFEGQAEKAEEGHKEQELPIQAYYHRAFFGEPWREAERSRKAMEREGLLVLDLVLLVEGTLWIRRRQRA